MDRINKLKEFLKESPQDSFLNHALALEYVKTGDDHSAKEIFEGILQREPGYVGSYYHLAKLLERKSDVEGAMTVYRHGIEAARKAGDNHAMAELRSALEELEE